MDDDYSRPTTDTPTEKKASNSDTVRHEAVLCKHATLPAFTQIRVKMVTAICGLINTGPKHSLWARRLVRRSHWDSWSGG